MDVTETIRGRAAAVPPHGDRTDPTEDERRVPPAGILDRMQPPTPETPMVGRRDELADLATALRRAREGTAGMVVLTGEGGIGKTRLLQRAAAEARSEGIPVLVGGSAPYPYAPLVGILRELRRAVGDPRLQRMLTGVRRPLVRLVPGLEPGSTTDPAVTAQAPLFEGVLDLVAELGRDTPVLVGMEDLHQADESTLELVRFLAANMTTERAVLVATCRTDGMRSERLGGFLAEVVRHPAVRRFDLAPLSDAEVTQLLTEIQQGRPPEETAVRIARRSQGNPFYVEELLAAGPGDADLPHGLEELLVARLAGLSPETREVLRAASALGERPHDHLLRAITDLPDTGFQAGLQEAADHGLLVPEGDLSERYGFRHDLIREVVHRRLLVDQRQRFHIAAARALEADPGLAAGGSDQVHAELARHWHLAGEPDAAFTASLAASEEARRVHALSEALAHLQRALELWGRASEGARDRAGRRHEVELRGAELAVLLADPETAIEHLDRALAEPDVPDATRALLHARASVLLRDPGREDEVEAHLAQALRVLPAGASAERAAVLARCAAHHMLSGRPAEALTYSEEAIEVAQRVGAGASEALARNYHGGSLHALGREQEGLEHLRTALTVARAAEDSEEIKHGYINLSVMLARSGLYTEGIAVANEGRRWASEHGIGRSHMDWLAFTTVKAMRESGSWEDADDLLSSVRSVTRRSRLADILEALTIAGLRIGQGRLEEVRERLRLLDEHLANGSHDPQMHGPYLALRVEFALAERRYDEAWREASRAREASERLLAAHDGFTYDAFQYLDPALAHGIRSLVERSCSSDDQDREETDRRARELLDTLRLSVDEAPNGTHVRDRLLASLTAGEAELTRLDGGGDPGAWRAAVEAAATTGIPYRVAYARFRLAEALLGADDRDAATESLEEADRIAGELGAEPLRQEIAKLARRGRLGLDAARRDEALGDDLTPREHDVLELLVEGRTNRQIGERLYISEKTVERHVTSILSKLQVDNRTEAASVARKRQLVGAS